MVQSDVISTSLNQLKKSHMWKDLPRPQHPGLHPLLTVKQNILPGGDVQKKPGPGLMRLLLQQAQAASESPDHSFVCLESKQKNAIMTNTNTIEIKH